MDGAAEGTPKMHGCPVTQSHGQEVIHPTREQYLDVAKSLADEGYTMALDLCGVDYLQHMSRPLPYGIVPERFEVVVQLLDIGNRRRTRLRLTLSLREACHRSECSNSCLLRLPSDGALSLPSA